MTEERMEVLRLLKDGKISAEEAACLLRALDGGGRDESRRREHGDCEHRDHDRGGHDRGGHDRGGFGGWGANWLSFVRGFGSGGADLNWNDIEDALRDFGRRIKDEVERAVRDPWTELGHLGAVSEEVRLKDGGFVLPLGTILALGNRERGDIELNASASDCCSIEGGVARVLRLAGPVPMIIVELSSAHAKVSVPASAKELKVVAAAGTVRGVALPLPVNLKCMGGDIDLAEQSQPFVVQTLGGRVHVQLAAGAHGTSRAETFGGDIDIEVPRELRASVDALTIGGTLVVDPALGESVARDARGAHRTKLDLGGGGESIGGGAKLDLGIKTVGGAVRLRLRGAGA